MAITITPPIIGIPTVEPIRIAALDVLTRDMPQALSIIAATYTDPPLPLPEPAGYSQEVVNSYELVQEWPFVSVFSGESNNEQPNQQLAGGLWKSELIIEVYLQHSENDVLTMLLDRYAAAVWLVLVNASEHRELAGAELEYGSEMITPDPSGGTQTERGVQVKVALWYRV